jgi:hypothetical protein
MSESEYCEPCGECRRCKSFWTMRRERAALRREVRKLKAMLGNVAVQLESHLTAAGPDEVRQHPSLRAQSNLLTRVERYLKGTP